MAGYRRPEPTPVCRTEPPYGQVAQPSGSASPPPGSAGPPLGGLTPGYYRLRTAGSAAVGSCRCVMYIAGELPSQPAARMEFNWL